MDSSKRIFIQLLKKSTAIVCLLLALAALCPVSARAERKTVRVGY